MGRVAADRRRRGPGYQVSSCGPGDRLSLSTCHGLHRVPPRCRCAPVTRRDAPPLTADAPPLTAMRPPLAAMRPPPQCALSRAAAIPENAAPVVPAPHEGVDTPASPREDDRPVRGVGRLLATADVWALPAIPRPVHGVRARGPFARAIADTTISSVTCPPPRKMLLVATIPTPTCATWARGGRRVGAK